MMDNDTNWLGLLFMLGAIFMNPELKEVVEKKADGLKRMADYQKQCEYVEWEEDMGKHIPWCKLTGGFCDVHCLMQTQREE